ADEVVRGLGGRALDAQADTATLEHVAGLIPGEWLEPAATGSAERCAERVLRQFDLGVDGVVMPGASPRELAPAAKACRALRQPPPGGPAWPGGPGPPGPPAAWTPPRRTRPDPERRREPGGNPARRAGRPDTGLAAVGAAGRRVRRHGRRHDGLPGRHRADER